MDFRDLTYVTAIATHQSITKAARELYVSQPTLSKFLQNLERDLGQPLFKRLGNRFLLTYAGERYVEKAKKILLMKKELDGELSDILRENVGELKIAFPIMRGTYMLPLTLPRFRQQFPLVRVDVQEANSSVLEGLLLSGSIDLAFLNLPIKNPELDYEVISEEEVVLMMAPDHPLAAEGVEKPGCRYPWIDLKRLRNEEFVLYKPDQRTYQIVDRMFKSSGITPNVLLTVRNVLASVELSASGYGMSFICDSHLRHINLPVKPACFSVGKYATTTDFVAAFRKGVYLPHYAREYIKIVKDFT